MERVQAEVETHYRSILVENLRQQGVEIPATSRAETAAFIRREMAKYAEVVKFSGATVD